MAFSRDSVRRLRDQLQAHLETFARQHNVQIRVGRATFAGGYVRYEVELAEFSAEGMPETKETSDFKRCALTWGLQPSDLGRTFVCNGMELTIVGAAPRNRRYPILAKEIATGTVYKFPAESVRLHLQEKQQGEGSV